MLHARACLIAVVVAVLGACGGKRGGFTELEGAVESIPIFRPSSLVKRSEAFTSDDLHDLTKFSTYTWYLKTSRSPEEVEAFYLAQWPGASRSVSEDGVYVRYPPVPEEDEDGNAPPLPEGAGVMIHAEREGKKTLFDIHEDVYSSRRP